MSLLLNNVTNDTMTEIDPDQPYILKIRNVLSPEECGRLITRIENLEPETATINTIAGTLVNREIRNNDRVIFDDVALAATVRDRLEGQVPDTIFASVLVGANERFRCYRYQPGMRFAPHADGAFHRNENEQSYYSCLIYLNEDFEGGETTFLTEPEVVVRPETGMCLLIQHPLIHEGSIVKSGVKYVCRTDLMYRTCDSA